MKKNSGIKTIVPFMFLLTFSFGCLPQPKEVVLPPKSEMATRSVLPSDIIDKKITALSSVLGDEGLNAEDRELALSLLSAYNKLRAASHEYDLQKIIEILFNHLDQLDEKYFLLVKRIGEQQYSEAINLFNIKRKEILDDYLLGDYSGVINGCFEFEEIFGRDSLTPDIGLIFAISLGKKEMLREAIGLSEKISRELEGKPDLIHLRANIIQWQLELGNREKGFQVYEKLADNFMEREKIFRGTKNRVIQAGDIIAGRGATSSDIPPLVETEEQEPSSRERLLKEVERLVRRHEFRKAKLLLVRNRIKLEEGPEVEIIDQAMKSVDLAEQRYQDSLSTQSNQEEETLKLAKKLIEQENFEDALSKLEELPVERGMSAETQEMRDLAIEKLINRERNEAAKLFLEARNTQDYEKRGELLLSSYNILRRILDKYPSYPLSKRVNDHIKKVKEELDKLGKNPG